MPRRANPTHSHPFSPFVHVPHVADSFWACRAGKFHKSAKKSRVPETRKLGDPHQPPRFDDAPMPKGSRASEIALAHVEWAERHGFSWLQIGRSVGACPPSYNRTAAVLAVADAWRRLNGLPESWEE
jgi:hypothetical protein